MQPGRWQQWASWATWNIAEAEHLLTEFQYYPRRRVLEYNKHRWDFFPKASLERKKEKRNLKQPHISGMEAPHDPVPAAPCHLISLSLDCSSQKPFIHQASGQGLVHGGLSTCHSEENVPICYKSQTLPKLK